MNNSFRVRAGLLRQRCSRVPRRLSLRLSSRRMAAAAVAAAEAALAPWARLGDIAFLGYGWRAPRDVRVFIVIAAFLGEHYSLVQYSWVCRRVNRPPLRNRFSFPRAWASWHRGVEQLWVARAFGHIRVRVPFASGTGTNIYRIVFWQGRLGVPLDDQIEMGLYDTVYQWIWTYEPWRLLDPDAAVALYGAAGRSP